MEDHWSWCWSFEGFQCDLSTRILREMWKDREHANFEIRCGAKSFKIHKTILRAHSEVLTKACDNRSFKEALSGVLKLKSQPYEGKINNLSDGDDPKMVEEMIYFFYHLNLSPSANPFVGMDDNETSFPDYGHQIVYLARLYVLAEKYFVEGMKQCIQQIFNTTMNNILNLSSTDYAHLVEACRIVYKATSEPSNEYGLKSAIAQRMAQDVKSTMQSPTIEALLLEIPEMAIRILKEMPEPKPRYNSYSSLSPSHSG